MHQLYPAHETAIVILATSVVFWGNSGKLLMKGCKIAVVWEHLLQTVWIQSCGRTEPTQGVGPKTCV